VSVGRPLTSARPLGPDQPGDSGLPGDAAPAGKRTRPAARRRTWRRLAAVGAALVTLVAVRSFVVTPVAVQGTSMEPTVHNGVALVGRWVDPATLHRGELVVFTDPQGTLALKRVVGVAGDSVAIADAALVVDGRRVHEPYVDESRIDGTYFGPVKVPNGTIFVMGDNRSPSIDSRSYGAISYDRVLGRVLFTW
jgi:signal peptidase I